jgi:lipid-A-disaccharide synthase-like uncharacterized protein
MHTTQVLGLTGAAIVAAAYVPQITHMAREHCSGGVSRRAWLLWMLASALTLSHALAILDVVFIVVQAVNIVAILLIIMLAKRYEQGTCASHAHGTKSS